MNKFCNLGIKKVFVFVSVTIMLFTLFSSTAFAENTKKSVKLTGTKVEASSLKKNSEGKLYQEFTGNYLLIKQSTFAIVWTSQELSTEAKEEFNKRIVELDPSLKNGIKEKLIFVTSTTITKAQNSKTNNVYKIEGTASKYKFTVVSGGVSHIVYGIYEYNVNSEKPEVKPTAVPETKPTVKPTTSPTTKPVATAQPSDNKTDNAVKPSENPAAKPTGNPEVIATVKPEEGNVDSANNNDGEVDSVVKTEDKQEALLPAQTTTDEKVLAANMGKMDKTPKTGDNLPLLAGIAALIASLAVMLTVTYIKKKC